VGTTVLARAQEVLNNDPALLAVIGPTEIVLIVIGVVLMLGIPTVGAVIL
jgi:hypothetical protein